MKFFGRCARLLIVVYMVMSFAGFSRNGIDMLYTFLYGNDLLSVAGPIWAIIVDAALVAIGWLGVLTLIESIIAVSEERLRNRYAPKSKSVAIVMETTGCSERDAKAALEQLHSETSSAGLGDDSNLISKRNDRMSV